MRPLIVHIVTRLENGGAQRQTLQIVRQLPRDEFEAALAYGPGGYLDPEAEAIEDLMRCPVMGMRRNLGATADAAALWQLVGMLKPLCKQRPVIVHTHSSKAGVLGRLAGKWAGAKAVVHTVHGFGFHAGSSARSRKVLMHVERGMRRCSDWILTVAEADRTMGIEHGLIDAARSSVIRSGIDVAAFARRPEEGAALRRDLGIPMEAPVVGTVACFKPQKAPLDHLAAFEAFLAGEPDAHYIWVGDGDEMAAVRQRLAGDDALSERVHLLGWSDRIVAVLSALDLFLLISLWEGLPRSLLEARAASVPCVVSDTCGNPEAIEHGRHGLVVPMHAPRDAAQAMLKIWRDRDLRLHMAARVHDGLDAFDARHVTPMHCDLYRQLLH